MIFLDGSLGHVLIERSKKKSAGTWSAQFLLKDSHLISEIYDEYIEAGSDIITTNTYSTIPSYLSKAGLEGEMPTLIRRAGELAKNSALKHEGKIKVAGSIPPLDESYRPDLVHNLEQSLEVYEVLIKEVKPPHNTACSPNRSVSVSSLNVVFMMPALPPPIALA